jgi:CBS domain-containing protein
MSAPVVTVPASATVEDLLSGQVTGTRYSAFPVTDQSGRTVGLITHNQVRNVPAEDRGHTTLAQAACPLDQVPSCRPAEPLSDVMERMRTGCGDGRALVFDDSHLAGIISAQDITRALQSSGLSARALGSPPV